MSHLNLKKKGEKSDSANYKSISLASVVGKLLGTIIQDKVAKQLERKT